MRNWTAATFCLFLWGPMAMADEPVTDCRQMMQMIDDKLKVVRIRKADYDEIRALYDEGKAALEKGFDVDCEKPLRAAMRKLGLQ